MTESVIATVANPAASGKARQARVGSEADEGASSARQDWRQITGVEAARIPKWHEMWHEIRSIAENPWYHCKIEVPPAGFEPATHGLGNRCSIP